MSADVEIHEAIDAVAPEWDELCDATGAPPFLRPGWVGAWWSAFGEGALEIIALRRAGRLAGVLPLERQGNVLKSTANAATEMFEPVVQDAEAARALASAVFARGARRVALLCLSPDAPGLLALRAVAPATGYRMVERTLQRSPFLGTHGDWAAYEAGLDGKLRREIRRRRRLLEAAGRLSLEVADGTERLDHLLDEGFRVEAAAWKGSAGTSIASRLETQAFYLEAARWAAGRGYLRLGFLRLDGRALAFDYCVEDAGVHYLMKTGYDPAHRTFGPGIIMRHEMIARAFSSGLRSYEFLGHDEPWKLRWTDARRERRFVVAFAPSLAGRLDWAAFAHARPLVKALLRRR